MSDAVRMGASSRLFQCENAPEAATVKGLAGSDRALAATVTNAAQTSAAAAPARSATAAPPRLRRSDFAPVEVDDNGHADLIARSARTLSEAGLYAPTGGARP